MPKGQSALGGKENSEKDDVGVILRKAIQCVSKQTLNKFASPGHSGGKGVVRTRIFAQGKGHAKSRCGGKREKVI